MPPGSCWPNFSRAHPANRRAAVFQLLLPAASRDPFTSRGSLFAFIDIGHRARVSSARCGPWVGSRISFLALSRDSEDYPSVLTLWVKAGPHWRPLRCFPTTKTPARSCPPDRPQPPQHRRRNQHQRSKRISRSRCRAQKPRRRRSRSSHLRACRRHRNAC